MELSAGRGEDDRVDFASWMGAGWRSGSGGGAGAGTERVAGANTHLSDDKTVAKMGHPDFANGKSDNLILWKRRPLV
jgi:hypothetical protein